MVIKQHSGVETDSPRNVKCAKLLQVSKVLGQRILGANILWASSKTPRKERRLTWSRNPCWDCSCEWKEDGPLSSFHLEMPLEKKRFCWSFISPNLESFVSSVTKFSCIYHAFLVCCLLSAVLSAVGTQVVHALRELGDETVGTT